MDENALKLKLTFFTLTSYLLYNFKPRAKTSKNTFGAHCMSLCMSLCLNVIKV
jgi:hypothetical protein